MLGRILEDGAGADADRPVMLLGTEIGDQTDRGYGGGRPQTGLERREIAIGGGAGDCRRIDGFGVGGQRGSIEIDGASAGT